MRIEILGSGHWDIVLGARFPYSVYYRIEEDCVKIWRILDNRRDPNWVDSQL